MATEVQSAKYGHGVLSHGEIILDSETDRLVAKRAWLQLFDHLVRSMELVNAVSLPIPWDLRRDPDVIRATSLARHHLSIYQDPRKLREYLSADESRADPENIERSFEGIKGDSRAIWIMDRIISENPSTVLDIGSGFGQITTEVAKLGIQVTAIAPFEEGCAYAKKIQTERALAIEWIHDVWESVQHEIEGTEFDVVNASEILEHQLDPLAFLKSIAPFAKKAIVMTTPYGPPDKGFPPYDPYQFYGQHVHAFTDLDVSHLFGQLEDFEVTIDSLPDRLESGVESVELPTLDKSTICVYARRK